MKNTVTLYGQSRYQTAELPDFALHKTHIIRGNETNFIHTVWKQDSKSPGHSNYRTPCGTSIHWTQQITFTSYRFLTAFTSSPV